MAPRPTSFRLTPEALQLLQQLATRKGISQRDVVEQALREEGKREGLWPVERRSPEPTDKQG